MQRDVIIQRNSEMWPFHSALLMFCEFEDEKSSCECD